MRAGKLRHRIEIQAAAETRNAYGEVTQSWGTVGVVWASIEPLRGRELWEAQQVVGRVTIRVRIRHWTGLTHSHRLQDGLTVYNIEAVLNPKGRDREMELLCTEAT